MTYEFRDPEILSREERDVFTITQAAHALRVSPKAIRLAIQQKRLHAFIIGGRDPMKAGRGLGYRITRAELRRWYFGVEDDK